MAATPSNPFNLRGLTIEPGTKEWIQYYLCLIDLPSIYPAPTFTEGVLTGSTLAFQLEGGFPSLPTPETPTTTYMLPIFVIKATGSTPLVNAITISDQQLGLTYQGDPNRLHPPIIEWLVAFANQPVSQGVGIANTFTINSATNADQYFVVLAVNTGTNGGFSNLISTFPPMLGNTSYDPLLPLNAQLCMLTNDLSKTGIPVAAIGAFSSTGSKACQSVMVCYMQGDIFIPSAAVPINWPITL